MQHPLVPSLSLPSFTYLSLVIGELVPKRLALNSPESIAVVVAKPIYWLSVALNQSLASSAFPQNSS